MPPEASTLDKGSIVFATTVHPSQSSQTNAVLLAESIRAFAGLYSSCPIWFMIEGTTEEYSDTFLSTVSTLDIELVPYIMTPTGGSIPFLSETHAAANAEELAAKSADVLVWLNGNSLVLKQPDAFLLPDGVTLGYRPVHHTLVGSYYLEPLDAFWSLIYQICKVPENRVFAMTPHVEDVTIRPYFNAGIIAARPETGILRQWCQVFSANYDLPALRPFYQKDPRYAIFTHQAIFSGVLLTALPHNELLELPGVYNYPLHLYTEDLTERRPSSVEDLVTCRHEGFYKDPSWRDKMQAGEPLKQWIADHLLPETK